MLFAVGRAMHVGMDTRPNPNAPFAVLRVDKRKAKALGAIAAASAHHLRQRPTPNAKPEGPAPIILHLAGGETPYQAASHLLEGAERRNKDTVLCREVVLSASPSYFRPGREAIGGVFDPDRTKAWARITLAWAKRQWPDQLASAVLHLDEQTPHIHLLVVPRTNKPDGGWRLNSKALFDRQRLRDLQTAYGEAVAPLGIQRGLPGSMATHTTVRQFYGAALKAGQPIPRIKPPKAPKPPERKSGVIAHITEPLAKLVGIETERARMEKRYEKARRVWQEEARKTKQLEQQAWDELQQRASFSTLLARKAQAAVRPNTGEPTPKPRPASQHGSDNHRRPSGSPRMR